MDAFPQENVTYNDDDVTGRRMMTWRADGFDPVHDDPPWSLMQPVTPRPITTKTPMELMPVAHEKLQPKTNGWGEVRRFSDEFETARDSGRVEDADR